MRDQAERLRQIVRGIKEQKDINRKRTSRVVTITSGKGGVGKTSFTVNLAICLGAMGYRVVIIDGDFGLANVDLMLGITSKYDLSYFISSQKEFDEVAVKGPNGIRFISGGSGVRELIDFTGWKMEQLLSRLEKLDQEADIVLIDTGAGVSDNVVKMILASDETILLVTPEPTSIMDAYALVKIAVSEDPNIRMRLVVNKADNVYEAKQILDKFSNVARKFLKVEMDRLGYLCNDDHVPRSVKQQSPYVLSYPKSSIAKQIQAIADELVRQKDNEQVRTEGGGLAAYIKRLMTAFK